MSKSKSQHKVWPHPTIHCNDEFQSSWYHSVSLVSFHICDIFWLCLACRSISLSIFITLLHTEPRLGRTDNGEYLSYSYLYVSPLQQCTWQWFLAFCGWFSDKDSADGNFRLSVVANPLPCWFLAADLVGSACSDGGSESGIEKWPYIECHQDRCGK